MKVTTDTLILGSWVEAGSGGKILDIGCGSGILTLMMLQKFAPHCYVDALDIDTAAVSTAELNIANSPWRANAKAYHHDILDWSDMSYDIIVTNPPYFEIHNNKNLTKQSHRRRQATHQYTLTVEQLLNKCVELTTVSASIFCMYPYDLRNRIIEASTQLNMAVVKRLDVQHNAEIRPYLTLFHLKKGKSHNAQYTDSLTIMGADDYTDEFKLLCKDFYLRF